jgi:hypothetical protein
VKSTSPGETQTTALSGDFRYSQVEKDKTLHLPFPLALRLEAGGYVEVNFQTGKDIVFVSANGRLVDV